MISMTKTISAGDKYNDGIIPTYVTMKADTKAKGARGRLALDKEYAILC